MGEREKLVEEIGDGDIIRYFYLDKASSELIGYFDRMKLRLVESQDEVPFNAQVKSYLAASDGDGDPWIVKPVSTASEMLYHRACMLAYILDHATGTLAAPTTAVMIDGKMFRATKVVRHAMQISSYNYLESPYIGILRADLVNRWIYFDEDRNPNNYLVITNSKNRNFVVAIDYDKADMMSEAMKITGMEGRFGWQRTEKTRFLTLLRPEHFEGITIKEFERRLSAFTEIGMDEFLALARAAFSKYCDDPEEIAKKVSDNFARRREYVDCYFRSMFGPADISGKSCDDDYSAFGKSFLDMHNKKK